MSRQDFGPGISFSITWLHERAKEMCDPHATQILNSAAFNLGSAKAKGGYVLNDELSALRDELEAVKRERDRFLHDCAEYDRALDDAGEKVEAAEAQLEEMTRSCLAERAGRLAAEARADKAAEDTKKRCIEALHHVLAPENGAVDYVMHGPRGIIQAAIAAIRSLPLEKSNG